MRSGAPSRNLCSFSTSGEPTRATALSDGDERRGSGRTCRRRASDRTGSSRGRPTSRGRGSRRSGPAVQTGATRAPAARRPPASSDAARREQPRGASEREEDDREDPEERAAESEVETQASDTLSGRNRQGGVRIRAARVGVKRDVDHSRLRFPRGNHGKARPDPACPWRGPGPSAASRRRPSLALVLVVAALASVSSARPRADFVLANGNEPESLDPALASGTPEGRVVRALFEGLVVLDPETLEPAARRGALVHALRATA